MNNLVIPLKRHCAQHWFLWTFLKIFEKLFQIFRSDYKYQSRLLFHLEQWDAHVDPDQTFYGEFWWSAS